MKTITLDFETYEAEHKALEFHSQFAFMTALVDGKHDKIRELVTTFFSTRTFSNSEVPEKVEKFFEKNRKK